MDEFTQAEKARIDELYGNDFEGITPEDMPLIQRYEQYKALNDARFKAEIEMMQKEADAKIAEAHETAVLARERLEERAQRSRERWEVLRNGQEETR